MGVWKKSQEADPATLAAIQARVAPWIADLQKQASEASRRTGRSVGWTEIPGQIKQRLAQQGVRLPDGYDVDMQGRVVYTNKTPFLQQMAWAASPFAVGQAASSLSGLIAPTAAASGSSAAASSAALPGYMAAPGVPNLAGGSSVAKGLFSTLGKFFGSPGGAQVLDTGGQLLGGVLQARSQGRAADLASQYNQQALDYLKQQDARDFAEYMKERERDWRIADEDRAHRYKREGEREGRLAPFRQGAERGYQTLSSLLFNPAQPMAMSPAVGSVQRRSLADLVRS